MAATIPIYNGSHDQFLQDTFLTKTTTKNHVFGHSTHQRVLAGTPVKNWRVLFAEVLLPMCPC